MQKSYCTFKASRQAREGNLRQAQQFRKPWRCRHFEALQECLQLQVRCLVKACQIAAGDVVEGRVGATLTRAQALCTNEAVITLLLVKSELIILTYFLTFMRLTEVYLNSRSVQFPKIFATYPYFDWVYVITHHHRWDESRKFEYYWLFK